jgi:site-specific recombinase XerD
VKPFKSVLADRLEEFFTYRRQLGFARDPMLSYLKMLDRYLCEHKATADKLQPYFFLDLRANLKLSPSSINRVIRTGRAVFNFMIRNDYCRQNPLKDIPTLAEHSFIPFIFSAQQTDELLSAVCKKIRKDPKYFVKDLGVYIVHVLLARCGLRISEPLALLRSHYRLNEATLYIEKTKFRKDRLIPLPKTVITEIENYLSVRTRLLANDHNPHLIAGTRDKKLDENRLRFVFHQAVKEIGLNQAKQTIANMTFGSPTPHSLRHSFAANTLKNAKARGISPLQTLPVLATYMGHCHYTYTTKYLKLMDADHRNGLARFACLHKQKI